jgi:hypothetical protein
LRIVPNQIEPFYPRAREAKMNVVRNHSCQPLKKIHDPISGKSMEPSTSGGGRERKNEPLRAAHDFTEHVSLFLLHDFS